MRLCTYRTPLVHQTETEFLTSTQENIINSLTYRLPVDVSSSKPPQHHARWCSGSPYRRRNRPRCCAIRCSSCWSRFHGRSSRSLVAHWCCPSDTTGSRTCSLSEGWRRCPSSSRSRKSLHRRWSLKVRVSISSAYWGGGFDCRRHRGGGGCCGTRLAFWVRIRISWGRISAEEVTVVNWTGCCRVWISRCPFFRGWVRWCFDLQREKNWGGKLKNVTKSKRKRGENVKYKSIEY